MDCDWGSLLSVLPGWLRQEVDELGKNTLQELRLRQGQPPELILEGKPWELGRAVTQEDLTFCINAASGYSPWSVESCAEGYLTITGGHRMGLCGQCVTQDGRPAGFRELDSLCIRVARDLRGLAPEDSANLGSVLILGAPGWGKTTLLRCICRRIAQTHCVCVVDERQELFPRGFQRGRRMDVLSGCGKEAGIEMVLRSMGPDYIAVDEITAQADAQALVRASGCGVRLLATAHAAGKQDLLTRPCYQVLLEKGIFDTVLLLNRDKSFHRERMERWVTNG